MCNYVPISKGLGDQKGWRAACCWRNHCFQEGKDGLVKAIVFFKDSREGPPSPLSLCLLLSHRLNTTHRSHGTTRYSCEFDYTTPEFSL